MRLRIILGDLAAALVAVLVAALTSELAFRLLGVTRVGVLFLAGCIVAAAYRGRMAGIYASLLSVVAYNFSMVPRNTLTLTPEDLVNVITFLVVALIVGNLAGALKENATRIAEQAQRMELLFQTSREMSATASEKAIWGRLCEGVTPLAAQAALLDGEGRLLWQIGNPIEEGLAARAHETSAGPEELRPGRIGGLRTLPLKNGQDHLGVLLWRPPEGKGEDEAVSILGDLAAASIARNRLSEEAARLKTEAQGERFRDILLSSVSHDFRSPLAAIIGSVTSLMEYGDRFDASVRRDLLLNIKEEGERLNHFVENLLSWSRIRAGTLQLNLEPVNLVELAERVVRRLLGTEFAARCSIRPAGASVATADPVLLEQAIFNLIDNALRYSAPDGRVEIRIACGAQTCEVEITDEGPGMNQKDLTGSSEELAPTHIHGSGLGLSIARGMLAAMGGGVRVANRADGPRGLCVTVSIPAQG